MRSTILTVLSAAVANGLPTSSTSSGSPPSVTIKNGTVEGIHSSTYNQDIFLGVPFAQPPVGELRFRNPQSINTTFSETVQATEYAPECVGYGVRGKTMSAMAGALTSFQGDQINYPVSEDCLYLNVIRPCGYEDQDLPVGVWIHGGGLYEGGTRDERYNLSFSKQGNLRSKSRKFDHEAVVQNSVDIGKPIIGVSIAYRISAWGFLQSQEVSGSGNTNMGLRDQRLALHWLQENLGAFGGDPSKVTIWGESAGAGSVGWHITAYNGRDDGLFRAGIMESGNPVAYSSYKTNEQYQPLYNKVVKEAGCEDAIDNLDCLRHVPYAKLDKIFNTTTAGDWQPIVDGDFIARWASIQLAEGDFVKVPIIDGANTDEGTAFGPQGVNTTQDFVNFATSKEETVSISETFASELPSVYPNEPSYWIPPVAEVGNVTYPEPYGPQYRRSAAYFGDAIMIANRRGACETWAANDLPAYCYRFNTIPAGIPWEVGVTHFQEVAFVFDNTDGLGYNAAHGTVNPFAGKPKSYYELAKLMSCSWASFIYDLDPNGFEGRFAGADAWPQYSLDEPQNIVWDANTTGLAVVEADTWRSEGIQWILDHALDYHR